MKKYGNKINKKMRIVAIIFLFFISTLSLVGNNISAEVDNDLEVASNIQPLKVAGYHTYAETNETLYSIEENYTNIAKVYNLGEMFPNLDSTNKTTWDGRNILAIKISDNPELNETDEPNVLYMGTHHAREVIANEILLYFLNSIVENYTVNQTITDLINTRELWIVPIVNPDGVEYFHEFSFGWRKNRRDNGDGSFGVDLNRNYGWMWGLNDVGSNPNTNHPNYRGPGPFSEPETQMIRDLAHKYDFKLMLTFHSSGELILYPWGYTTDDTPDEYLFEAIGHEMAKYNGYTVQQGIDLYPTNGETTDWFYENFTTLGFTIEACISGEQVPPQNKIIPICQENYEPCIVVAQIADDPYNIFKSGIQGKITDTQDVPLVGVKVTTTFMGDEKFSFTDSNGDYKITLPSGLFTVKASKVGYAPATRTNVPVSLDQYTVRNIKLTDIVPPVITTVASSVGTDTDNAYEVGQIVRINVTEQNNETGLMGTIEIDSTTLGYHPGKIDLTYNSTTQSYVYYWNTTGLLPTDDYVIESNLTDFDLNFDGNGSNDIGPDLTIQLTDATPPTILNVDSEVGADNDEIYETNSLVQIKVFEKFGEHNLTGTIIINSTKLGYSSGSQALNYDIGNHYYWDWDTVGLEPADDFWVETTLKDPSDNIDLDGLPQTPDLVIIIQDTIAPEISSVNSTATDPFGDKDTDGRYEIRSIVNFTIKEKYGEKGLRGTINISSLSTGYASGVLPLNFDSENNSYYYVWDTGGLQPAIDYLVDTTLIDNSSNSDPDGSNNSGPDIIIELQDTIAPVITSVDTYVLKGPWGAPGDGADNDERYELGALVRVMVREELDDPHLMGTVRIYSISQSYDTNHKQLKFDDISKIYYWDWNTTGLQIAEDYRVDATLQDEWGNKDSDGSTPSGPDLIMTLEDTTAPTITSVSSLDPQTGEDNGTYELGSTVRIIVAELHNELGLYGTVRIASNSTGYDSGIQLSIPDLKNRTYYWDWDTSENVRTADDFAVETTLQDYYNNSDLDGLPVTPDLTIKLIDTTAPPSVTNVNVVEDTESPGEVHIDWDGMGDGATVHIYRDTSPFDEDNITAMMPIYTSGPNATSSYTDTVSPDGTTYYYAVIIEDSNGNVNWAVTAGNTDTVKISKPKSSGETEESFFEGEGLWWLIIIIVIIILVIIISVFVLTRKRRVEPRYEEQKWADEPEKRPPPPPPASSRGRKGKAPPRKRAKKRELELDWDEPPPTKKEKVKKVEKEPPIDIKPGGRPKDYETNDLDKVRAALWDDIQDEYGEQPEYMPHGAADYDYEEAAEYTQYEDEAPITDSVRPSKEAEVDSSGSTGTDEAEEDDEEEIYDMDAEDDEEEEEEEEEETDDGDIDWD